MHFSFFMPNRQRLRGALPLFLSLLPVLCILGGYRFLFLNGGLSLGKAAMQSKTDEGDIAADAAEAFPAPDALELALLSRYAASLRAQDNTVPLRILSAACAVQCNRAKQEKLSLCTLLLSQHFPLLCEPDVLCERAARDALLGYDPSGGALAFVRGTAPGDAVFVTAVFSDYVFFSPAEVTRAPSGEKSS